MYNRRQMFPINLSHWIILSDNVLDLGNNVLDLGNYVLDLGINYMFINQYLMFYVGIKSHQLSCIHNQCN